MIDINGLKKINDNYGHETGDNLIVLSCNMIRGCSRSTDIFCRIGGDEYVIICPTDSKEAYSRLLERIRKAEIKTFLKVINKNNIEEQLPVFLSIGVASSTESDIHDVLKLADKRMYEDKKKFYKSRERHR